MNPALIIGGILFVTAIVVFIVASITAFIMDARRSRHFEHDAHALRML